MLLPIALCCAAWSGHDKFDPRLLRAVELASPQEQVEALVVMRAKPDLAALLATAERLPKAQRAGFARAQLEDFASASQSALEDTLRTLALAGEIAFHERLWNVNAARVRGSSAALETLAGLPEVERLLYDPRLPAEQLEDAPPLRASAPASLPYATSFESGVLGPEFELYTSGTGRVQVSSSYSPSSGSMHLTLDAADNTASEAIAFLHVDLSGVQGALLGFDLRVDGDSTGAGDGVFIEGSGGVFQSALQPPSNSAYTSYLVDLGLLAAQQGVPFTADTRIAIAWEGSGSLPTSGYSLDNLFLYGNTPPAIAPEANISALEAPLLWQLGFRGDDALVLHIDVGVERTHPALAQSLWNNPGELDGDNLDNDGNGKIDDSWGWDFTDNDKLPLPVGDQHGTRTAGILVGNGALNLGAATGMAPEARLAVARASSQGDLLAAYQYAIAIGADVICSSVTLKWPDVPDYGLMRAASEAELAAGIVHANSIGNQGLQTTSGYPLPYNIGTPGNCPGPWRHPGEVAGGRASVLGCAGIFVGTDGLYQESGQGPAAWEDVSLTNPSYPHAQTPAQWDYPYAGGSAPGLLKPDLCGYTNVKTTTGVDAYVPSFGGTSAATPHIGGALCLLVDVNPCVPPRQLSQALQETALDLGPPGKDARYGAGKPRVYAAAKRLMAAVTAYPNDPAPGELCTLELSGPLGASALLAFSFSSGTIPTTLGFDLELGLPVGILFEGALTGTAAPIELPIPVPPCPALSGLAVFFQLVTDDTLGLSGEWLVSLREDVLVR